MATKKLQRSHKKHLEALGRRVEKIILDDMRYKSLDAFALEYHEKITKKTLYDLCKGNRDMKLSTLFGLAEALNVTPSELIRGLYK